MSTAGYKTSDDLPKTFRDWQGNDVPTNYPKGRVIASCGDVHWIRRRRDVYAVVYGLQVKDTLPYYEAATEFGTCVGHQAECNGLLDTHPPQ